MLDGLKIKKLENGNLELSIPEIRDRVEAFDFYHDRGDPATWDSLLERYFTNGSYHPVDPEVYDIGLTSDPYILTEELSLEDDGSTIIHGGLWHDPHYQVRSVTLELVVGATVTLQRLATNHIWSRLSTHEEKNVKAKT